jgi:hypothetical protein
VRARIVEALGLFMLSLLAACSGHNTPNKIPGQCVLSDGVWWCGAGYGNYVDCPVTSGPCNAQGPSVCFTCLYMSVGTTCFCDPTDGGGTEWQCQSSESGQQFIEAAECYR